MPANLVPPETTSQTEINPDQQIINSEVIIAPPPTSQRSERIIPPTSAPVEALREIPPRTKKGRENARNTSGMIMKIHLVSRPICAHRTQPRRKRRASDVASVQPLVIQTIADNATRKEPISNPFPSPVIREVSSTDPRIRPGNQSSPDEQILDEENM